MSGGYGGGRGSGGYPGNGGYGAGPGGPRQAGGQPRANDQAGRRDRDSDLTQEYRGQGNGRPGYGGPGYQEQAYGGAGGQSRGGRDYESPDYDDLEYDQDYGPRGYDGPGYAGQGYAQPGGTDDRSGRTGTGASPTYRSQEPVTGPRTQSRTGGQPLQRTGQRGTGAQQAQRMPGPGTGGSPVQRGGPISRGPVGYDQRGAGPRRAAGGYDDDYPAPGYAQRGEAQRGEARRGSGGYPQGGQGDWEADQAEESFLPGFGRRDDSGGGRGRPPRDGRGQGRADRFQGQPGYDGEPDDYEAEHDSYGAERDAYGAEGDAYGYKREPQGGGPRGHDGRLPVGRGPGGGRPGGGRPGGVAPGGRRPASSRPDQRGRGDQRRDRDDDWDADERDLAAGDREDAGRGGKSARRRSRSPIRRFAPWIALLVILVPVIAGGLYVYQRYESRYHPPDFSGPGTGEVTVQVMNGDTAFSLAPRLAQLGVVASARAFENAAEASPNTTSLEAGYYMLHHDMQASLAFAALLNPKNRVQTVVTIPEGLRAVDVALVLAKKTKLPFKDFQQVIAHPAQLGLPSYANGKVEGYLFPDTYAIQPHETALQILQAMVAQFKVEAQQINIVAAAKSVGLTPTQLIVEASLVQAEGGQVSDYPKIAEVIFNRLKANTPLHFDSTVFYGLGKYGTSATDAEINTPGPYNTYLNVGLPPGPIDNPGNAAIQGVLHRLSGNLFYFIATASGKTYFSATFPVPIPGG